MEELQDILDEIVPDSNDCVIQDEEFVTTVLHLMEEYVQENIEPLMEEDFHEVFLNETFELVLTTFGKEIQFYNYVDCKQRIDEIADIFYDTIMPPRSYESTLILNDRVKVREITTRLDELRNIPQPEQRTAEWYSFRHNLITASNAYKTLMEGAEYNQIIFEKCKPLYVPGENGSDKEDEKSIKMVNVETTLHWGQKFEPLSVMIYEDLYDTKIEDFGCIQHSTYTFLGASPDGINVDSSSPRYGRMLEIKNIVNREITGIPKLEYWVQMQLQMETCQLEECDFLETRFKEYSDESSYQNDNEDSTGYKGVIMYFSKDGKPNYQYAPLDLVKSNTRLDKWEDKQHTEMEAQGYIWVRNIYWKLEEMSCVLVKRNKRWFDTVVGTMEKTWKTVVYERENGYDHRKPMKRTKASLTKQDETLTLKPTKCLIKLGDDEEDISVPSEIKDESEIDLLDNIKIRTESIDETRQKID